MSADCQYCTRSCFSRMPCPSMSGIKANRKDNLCCAACVTITQRARVEEVMWENKLLRRSEDVGKKTVLFVGMPFICVICGFVFIRMDINRTTGVHFMYTDENTKFQVFLTSLKYVIQSCFETWHSWEQGFWIIAVGGWTVFNSKELQWPSG